MRLFCLPVFLLAGMTALASSPSTFAQTATAPSPGAASDLTAAQKAVLTFDIDLEKIRGSEIAQQLGLEKQIETATAALPDQSFDVNKVNRIFGAISSVDDIQKATAAVSQGGDLPFEMFVRVELADAESAKQAMAKPIEDGKAIEVDGKTYYRPSQAGAPANAMAHLVDEKTIEFGTDGYVLRSDRKVLSDGLTDAWKKTPNDAIRIVADLEGAKLVVNEAIKLAKENGPANFAAMYDLLGAAADLRISLDLSSDDLLTIGMSGKTESDAENLSGGLDSLLGIAQFQVNQQAAALKEVAPKLAEMVGQMKDAMKTNRDGKDVTIVIPHPKGLGAEIKKLMPPQ